MIEFIAAAYLLVCIGLMLGLELLDWVALKNGDAQPVLREIPGGAPGQRDAVNFPFFIDSLHEHPLAVGVSVEEGDKFQIHGGMPL